MAQRVPATSPQSANADGVCNTRHAIAQHEDARQVHERGRSATRLYVSLLHNVSGLKCTRRIICIRSLTSAYIKGYCMVVYIMRVQYIYI